MYGLGIAQPLRYSDSADLLDLHHDHIYNMFKCVQAQGVKR